MTAQENEFALAEDLGIAGVAGLHEELRVRLDAGQPTHFLAAEVGRVDGAALQLLAAFARESTERGQPVAWTAPSDALRRAACLLGLESMLGLPAADD